ncbi:hypothetical protein ACFL2T_02040 [Elusimicrobiota bacterium]
MINPFTPPFFSDQPTEMVAGPPATYCVDAELLQAVRPRGASEDDVLLSVYIRKGRPFANTPLTVAELSVLRGLAKINLEKVLPGCCYRNAMWAAQHVPGLTYCEGLAERRGVLFRHAWLALGQKPIDITYAHPQIERCRRSRIDRIIERVKFNLASGYYYGVKIPRSRLIRHLAQTGSYSPVVTSGGVNTLRSARGLETR